MSKLVYTDVTSEIVYADGRSIQVWYPMGPREHRVVEIELPATIGVRQHSASLIIAMRQHDPENKGVSVAELRDKTGWSDNAIRSALLHNPKFFRRGNTKEPAEFMRNGFLCVRDCHRFYRTAEANLADKIDTASPV